MKTFKLSLCLVVLSLGAKAQNNIYPTAGNPTIYEYSPTIFLQRNNSEGGYTQGIQTRLFDGTNNWFFGNLHDGQWMVAKGDYNNPKFVVSSNGNVGIGTSTPTAKLSFNNVDNATDADGMTWFSGAPLMYGIYRTPGTWTAPAFQQLKLSWDTGIILDPGTSYGKSYVDIQGAGLRVTSGNVGIGTATPNEKLAVNGKIRAKEIKVETANWPDYVFEEDYKVGTLQELEGYIKTNKRLPEMPSAKEIEANGIALGEMVKLQQKKIEELTLHLIEKDKELSKERKVNQTQNERLKEIETLLRKLTQNK